MRPLGPIERGAARLAASALEHLGGPPKFAILIFHRVLAEPDPLNEDEPDAAGFAARMDVVRTMFSVLSLRDAVERMRSGTLPPRAACITFDDGYRNNREVAAPILAERGMPATFFIATGYLDGGRMWNDTVIEAVRRAPAQLDLRHLDLGLHDLPDWRSRVALTGHLLGRLKYLEHGHRTRQADAIAEAARAKLPDDLMMTTAQVREMARMGMEIGAHTVSHPILARMDDASAREEIVRSKLQLEQLLTEEVVSFAYPNGRPETDYGPRHPLMVREAGFQSAVSTARGVACGDSDLFQLPRLSLWDQTAGRYVVRLIRSWVTSSRPAS